MAAVRTATGYDAPSDHRRDGGRTALGSNFQTIVDVEAKAEEADELADAILAWLVETGVIPSLDCVSRNEVSTEGLVVITRRHVFFSLIGEDEITCPHCGHAMPVECDAQGLAIGMWQELFTTIGEWYDGGRGDRPCPRCAKLDF